MESEKQTTVYSAVGRCIYCGSGEGQLTREHIIPYGLGGTWVLPKSSCRTCAAITGEVEQFCLRPMLGPFRIQLKLPTRRPKERPTQLPIEFIRVDGNRERETMPIEVAPVACIGFRFPAPGLLRGVAPAEDFEGEMVVRYPTDGFLKHTKPEGQRVKLGTINMLMFARMLAKIGHSYAVAQLGLDGFRSLLPDLILGRSTIALHLVGGDASGPVPESEATLHHVYLQNCLTNGVVYLLAAIRLFAFVGMPRYHVVGGEVL